MAEGFEPYHVPQQSRRHKLRVAGASSSMEAAAASAALLPVYDPSLLPSDLLSCAAAAAGGFHNQNHPLSDPPHPLVKEEGPYQHYLHRIYTNHPQSSSMAVNPNTVADMNSGDSNDPFVLQPPQFRDLAQSYHSRSNNALALSLSSHGHDSNPSSHHHSSLELNLQRYGSTTIAAGGYLIPSIAGGGLQQNDTAARTSSGPLGPFTGYSSILKGSRFLKPTQLLLEELCEVGHNPPEKMGPADSSLMADVSMVEGLSESSSNSNCGDVGEFRRKKSRLISMLEEVCRRYRQYYQQMQDVVESFEYVAGFGNAAPYANLAVKAMSKHFRCLKNAITDQLQLNNKECARENPNKSKVESPRLRSNDGVQYSQRLSSSGYLENQPIWRPQRGLPERAVTVLRAWLFDHFLHPYPTDTDKIMLAKQTGLSRSQVSNWFINARVRLWKPMVEEIHMLETQQGQKSSQREERSNNPSTRANDDVPNVVNSLPSETPTSTTQRGHEATHKRTRNDIPDVTMRSDERRDLTYELSNAHHHHHQPHASFGEGISGVNNAVSLTLGLHQNNNGMSLAEPFQVNDVQRYGIGLEGSNHEGYVIGGFEAQHRHFARDAYGGHLLHDFVG